ncbi:MAG: hypothetical protein CVU89_16450 [Firmicutes bacterium HGW-Firmicutes-14]|jgi:uncharacterized RDD family membrane protein YckC|nr:MAG: hypothetical protein CVU89_16450 [Firmicutes bacterium HGW-Firmicutes-14]
MQDLSLYSSEKIYYSYKLAGLGSRFIGFFLDTLILIGIYAVLAGFGAAVFGILGDVSQTVTFITIAVLIIFYLLVSFGYFIFFETIWNGQTPGKKAAGLRVVRKTGEAVTFSSILVRNLMRIVDALPAGNFVGIAAISFSRNHQRVGDMVADTVVIRDDQTGQPILFEAGDTDPELAEKIRPRLFMVDEKDFSLIREFFTRMPYMKPYHAAGVAEKIAGGLASKLEFQPGEIKSPIVFLKTVGALFREK